MAQGANDTLINWGTADANAIAWRDTMIRMVNQILQDHGRAADTAGQFGYFPTDWGCKAKLRTADKKGFIG